MNQVKIIAENIRHRRESLLYTQEYMAYKMGLGQNAFSKIELNLTRLTVERLLIIAELLETDVATLMRPGAFTDTEAAGDVLPLAKV